MYCHSPDPILQKGAVAPLPQCRSHSRTRACNLTVPIIKTVQLLYCHSAVPVLQNGPVTVLSQSSSYTNTVQLLSCNCTRAHNKNGPVTLLSKCISYTTKRSSYCIVTVKSLYYRRVQLLYCHNKILILQIGPVTVM